MLQEFDYKKILEKYKEIKELESQIERISERISDMELNKIGNKKSDITGLKHENDRASVEKKKIGILKRLVSLLFRRGRYFKLTHQIKTRESSVNQLEEEVRSAERVRDSLKKTKEALEGKKKGIILPACIGEEDGIVVITDAKTGIGQDSLVDESGKLRADQKVLVHCTNFFPRENIILSNYDGEKIGSMNKIYRGVQKETRALSHRHEVHFTINNRVENTSDGRGEWNNPSYMIIDSFDVHKDELESITISDSWTKGTSVQLSQNSVIMVRLQDKDKLPILPEEMRKYNIVFYDGDPTICLQNFLRMNGYEICEISKNNASHTKSIRCEHEKVLQTRNLAINFIRDNTFISKEPPILSEEELLQVIDIAATDTSFSLTTEQSQCLQGMNIPCERQGDFLAIANFVICTGVEVTKDGRYTFKSDDETLSMLNILKKSPNFLPNNVDISLIYHIFEMQQRFKEQQSKPILPSAETIDAMTLEELYQFRNQAVCEMIQARLPEGMGMIGKLNNCVEFIIEECSDDINAIGIEKKIKPEDGIDCLLKSPGRCSLSIDINANTRVSEIGNVFAEFRRKIEEIRDRELRDFTICIDVLE